MNLSSSPLSLLSVAVLGLAPLTGFAAIPWDGGTPAGGPPQIELSAATAAPTKLVLGGHPVPLTTAPGGFLVTDYNAKKDIAFNGQIAKTGGEDQYDADSDTWSKGTPTFKYTAESDGLAISATFAPKDGSITVTGQIENKTGGDRPVILRYVLPITTSGATLETEISNAAPVTAQTKVIGTVFPMADMTGKDWGAAIVIPPTSPCLFGLTGSPSGLGLELYIGLTPKTTAFPNKAAFSFVIYPATPGWGFRSTLAQYYKNYSAYYDAAFPGAGFGLWSEKGNIDYALPLFREQGITGHATDFTDTVARAKTGNLLTIEYIGATQRDIQNLATIPSDYAGAMKAFADYKAKWDAMPEAQHVKDHPQFRYRDVMNVIEHDVIYDSKGQWVFAGRDFSWSPKSIAFTMNPNPALFADKGWSSVGAGMVNAARTYLKSDPVEGTIVDSLGANFPAHLNYREDHIPYEKYPLTFDRSGRVAIHNMISHYELMEALRDVDHEMHKFSMANGVYRYPRTIKTEESYNIWENGRFFIAALLDIGTRECSRLLTRQDLEFERVAMGRKLIVTAIHKWDSGDDVRIQMNRSLPFTVFSFPQGNGLYITNKNGYFRDKDVLEWFDKNARLLSDAGWQPMTWATVDHSDDVVCERYGSGNENYFAVTNFSTAPIPTQLTIDLASLGLAGKSSQVTEIARNATFTQKADANSSQVQINLLPSETCIFKVVSK